MRLVVSVLMVGLFAVGSGAGAAHPGSGARCADCHAVGASGPAPKVTPEPPGFWAKLLGAKALQGHPTVSCAGAVGPDGRLTGCHRPEGGGKGFLNGHRVGRPVDEFCGACHPAQRRRGGHHPSYRFDQDGDGVAETVVRPAAGQEVYGSLAPASLPEPVRRFPDALAFLTKPDGTRQRLVGLPLATVIEVVDGKEVPERDLVTCSTCHNPHHGYLVEVGSEEAVRGDMVARGSGDALLRLRDHTNALCEVCH